MKVPKTRIFGLQVAAAGVTECIELAAEWVRSDGAPRVVACLNPHSAVIARRDSEFYAALAGADMLLPDGVGVVAAARLLGGKISRRIAGNDLFDGLCDLLDREGGRSCFFLGSSDETLARIRERMAQARPRLRVVGTYSPPMAESFSPQETAAMVAAVNSVRPDVLWVGMTAPKQEKWIARNRELLEVPVIAAVGAVFDFVAGTVARPHPILRRTGLEWLGRLVREPRRMWRRTFISGPRFAKMVFEEALSQGVRGTE